MTDDPSLRGRLTRLFRPRSLIVALIVTGLGVGLALSRTEDPVSNTPSVSGPAQGQVLTVQTVSVDTRLQLVGSLEPRDTYTLTAPFDGTVRETLFSYGDQANKGAILLVMDTGDLETRIREAQIAVLRAEKALDDLSTWPDGPEVARARSAVLASRLALEESRRKAAETRRLLDRGIVPRLEWEANEQLARTQEIQLKTAEQDLKSTLDKGGPVSRHIADLDLRNARDRLKDLQAQMDRYVLEAPATGLILKSQPGGTNQPPMPGITAGQRVTRDQQILTIADTETLVVRAKVDEVDINRLRIGQAASVTGDAFAGLALNGQVAHIAPQATRTESGPPLFDLTVSLTLPDTGKPQLRAGMSAVLTITVRESSEAILLPPSALREDGSGPYVLKETSPTTPPVRVPVVPGAAFQNGIEVLEGVVPGDRIISP